MKKQTHVWITKSWALSRRVIPVSIIVRWCHGRAFASLKEGGSQKC